MADEYNFPVFATQGGGLVQEVAPDVYTFVEAPNCPGLNVGDSMPKEWGIIAVNTLAQRQVEEDSMIGSVYDPLDNMVVDSLGEMG